MVRLRRLEVAHNGWVPNPSGEAVAILELDEGLTGNAFLSLSLPVLRLQSKNVPGRGSAGALYVNADTTRRSLEG
jgi:hypothetical protein